ncbi:hypothetical protein LIER_34616 [Lithospermum erythrorhizon]|uniref:Uncharacterized protein n=1 Tax=Lithospermum erythrorhizon TaxID=34254 RepID=A0AAV3S1T7_LITER
MGKASVMGSLSKGAFGDKAQGSKKRDHGSLAKGGALGHGLYVGLGDDEDFPLLEVIFGGKTSQWNKGVHKGQIDNNDDVVSREMTIQVYGVAGAKSQFNKEMEATKTDLVDGVATKRGEVRSHSRVYTRGLHGSQFNKEMEAAKTDLVDGVATKIGKVGSHSRVSTRSPHGPKGNRGSNVAVGKVGDRVV